MKYISIVNFEEHQHYKNRRIVTWIKLYTKLLHSYKIYQLSPTERWCYIALLLLSPTKNNKIPLDYIYFRQFFGVKQTPTIKKVLEKLEKIGLITTKEYRGNIDELYTRSRVKREENIRKEKKSITNKLTNFFKKDE